MGFDTSAFERQEFSPREGEILVPMLKQFFAEDDRPIWTVRGLTHHELAKGIASYEQRKKNAAVLDLVAADAKDAADKVKHILGMDDDIPEDTARRMEHLAIGSVEPKISIGVSVKMAKTYPIDFIRLTNKIYELTGLGQEAKKKPRDCGSSQISKQA